MTTATNELDTDVVVVGGGVAGLTMAVALGVGGVPTVLVDQLPPQADAGGDGRTTALLQRPVNVLRGLGVWPALAAGAAPLRRMRIVNERHGLLGGAEVVFDAGETGEDAFGFNVANDPLRRALLGRLAELPAVRHLAPAAFAALERARDGAAIRLADGRVLKTRLLVAADGRESPVRTAVGIPVMRRDWHQTAIVCSFAHELPHEDTSTEIHRPGGPFTMVPLPGRRSSLVWVERTADAELFLAMARGDFEAALQTRTAGWLGAVEVADAPRGYPLAGRLATRLHAPRVALIAEAAHGLHPIGAQGLNLSLRDAACLAELVVDAFRQGADVGALELLRRYDARRRGDAFARFAATGGLNRVASTDNAVLRLARDLGLRGLAAARPLRALLMTRGMAALGPEPRLALGQAL